MPCCEPYMSYCEGNMAYIMAKNSELGDNYQSAVYVLIKAQCESAKAWVIVIRRLLISITTDE